MAGYDNNKLGELRPNQIITTFGPGSIVDAVKDSVTVLDINYWNEKGKKMDWNEFVNTFPIQLNQQQQEAVQSTEGAVLLLSLIHI